MMSSSLFDTWGNILYALSEDLDGNYQWEELIITNPWHDAKGHCYISCKRNSKRYYINFGDCNCANVSVYGPDNSIVYYDDMVIGTNKISIYNAKYKIMTEKLERYKVRYEQQLDDVKLLEKLRSTLLSWYANT